MNRGDCTSQRTGPNYLRLISPSQLNKINHDVDGGCERRWGFSYLLGQWEEMSASADTGVECHSQSEGYTRYGWSPTNPIAKRAIEYAPDPGVAECEVPIRFEMSGIH